MKKLVQGDRDESCIIWTRIMPVCLDTANIPHKSRQHLKESKKNTGITRLILKPLRILLKPGM